MIAVDGPYRSVIREQHEWLLTLILPVYRDADYQGLVAVDIGLRELLSRMPHLASRFDMIDLNEMAIPTFAIVHTSSPVNMQTIIRWYFISWIFSPN